MYIYIIAIIYIYIKHILHLTNLPQTAPFCLKHTHITLNIPPKLKLFGVSFLESPLTRLQFVASPRPRMPYTPGKTARDLGNCLRFGGFSLLFFSQKNRVGSREGVVGIYVGATTTPPRRLRVCTCMILHETQKLDDELPFGAKGLMAVACSCHVSFGGV